MTTILDTKNYFLWIALFITHKYEYNSPVSSLYKKPSMRSPFSAFALLYIVNKCINNNVATRPVNSVVRCDISTKTSEDSQLMLSIPKYVPVFLELKKTNRPTPNTAELQKYVPNFSEGKVCCLKQRIQV